jgi:hypothetical protein
MARFGNPFTTPIWHTTMQDRKDEKVSAFTPRQQARLQDMFDSADEFLAEYRVSEAADRIVVDAD